MQTATVHCVFRFQGSAGIETFKREMEQTGEIKLDGHLQFDGKAKTQHFEVLFAKAQGDDSPGATRAERVSIHIQLAPEVSMLTSTSTSAAAGAGSAHTRKRKGKAKAKGKDKGKDKNKGIAIGSGAIRAVPVAGGDGVAKEGGIREWPGWCTVERDTFKEFFTL